MNNTRFYLALNRIYGIGPVTIKKLLRKWPELEQMFAKSSSELEKEGLPRHLACAISSFDLDIVNEDVIWQSKSKTRHIITWDDEAYPPELKEIPDPPVVLYGEGDISVLKMPKLGIVGTRKPSIAGTELAQSFARELSQYGICIVSGLALGVDACAHKGCLNIGGKTIAVLGTGIDVIYPLRHTHLAEEITHSGLLLSEFPLKTRPFAGHFPRRNRIISGLSLGILVVEAAIRSGSLITANRALEQNREVFAIPGSINNPQARGCHFLLQQGAKLVTSVKDILDELVLTIDNVQEEKVSKAVDWLDSLDNSLIDYIGFEVTTIDQLMRRSGMDIASVTCSIANLELQGMVKAVIGGYVRCA